MKKKLDYRRAFLIGISLIAVGTSLISLQPKPIGIVFIAIGGFFLMVSFKTKNE